MNNREKRTMKKILFYGMDWQDLAICRAAADSLGIATGIVDDTCLDEPLEELFEKMDEHRGPHALPAGKYMLMADLPREELVELLRQIETVTGDFDAIKVALTDTNRHWQLSRVLQETVQEHMVMQKAVLLQQVIMACNSLDMTQLRPEDTEAFKKSLMTGYMMLKTGTFTEAGLDRVTEELMEHLRRSRKVPD